MKELWIELNEFSKKEKIEDLIEYCKNFCNVVLVEDKYIDQIGNLGICTASPSIGDIRQFDDKSSNLGFTSSYVRFLINDRQDEERAIEASEKGASYIIVSCPNWKIIPLENLIAETRGKAKIIAEVINLKEAIVLLETLELGVDGILLKNPSLKELKDANSLLKKNVASLKLSIAKIIGVKNLDVGSRVCIDTCDLMNEGEGMLVGCQSSALFLIQAEVEENPHVEPRPFRVNAGPISSYILVPDYKTRYLSELKAGDEVFIIDRKGIFRKTVIGRIKIEKRPLILVEAEIENIKIQTIVQNAETIKFISEKGSKSVSTLKPNDEVLVYFQPGGRHFGTLVKEESIIER